MKLGRSPDLWVGRGWQEPPHSQPAPPLLGVAPAFHRPEHRPQAHPGLRGPVPALGQRASVPCVGRTRGLCLYLGSEPGKWACRLRRGSVPDPPGPCCCPELPFRHRALGQSGPQGGCGGGWEAGGCGVTSDAWGPHGRGGSSGPLSPVCWRVPWAWAAAAVPARLRPSVSTPPPGPGVPPTRGWAARAGCPPWELRAVGRSHRPSSSHCPSFPTDWPAALPTSGSAAGSGAAASHGRCRWLRPPCQAGPCHQLFKSPPGGSAL